MRRAILIGLLLAFTTSANAQKPLPPTPVATPTFANLEARYAGYSSWQAAYTQQYVAKANNQTKGWGGLIEFQRPDSVVVNYVHAARCAYSPILLFLCGSPTAKNFTFETFDGSTMSFPGGVVFVATPISPTPTLVKVLLYVDRGTLNVRRVLTIDAQGNRNRFDFTSVVTVP